MSLRDQLKEILPKILPKDANEAMKGTELIRLVKFQLKSEYSDATLRYHFSILSADPNAPIAKVAQGQGYFLRPTTRSQLESAPSLIGLRQTTFNDEQRPPEDIDREIDHLGKFRAVIDRWQHSNQRYPFFFDHAYSADAPRETAWAFPEAVAVEWHVATAGESSIRLDQKLIDRQRALAAPLFRLTGMKLRIDVSLRSYREDFFQALSQSEWTNSTDFIIAAPIDDASLAEQLATLGQQHGVGVLSFGLTRQELDNLPSAEDIRTMQSSEFDAVLGKARFNRLSIPRIAPSVDWKRLSQSDSDSPDVEALLGWLDECLAVNSPISAQEFLDGRSLAALA